MGVTLKIMNPRGAVNAAKQIHSSPRLKDLAGKKIGILNNGKAGGLMLLPYLKEALQKNHPGIEIRQWEIPTAWPEEVKEPVLDEMANQSDGVIALMGD
jgi:hypothetical protein